MPIFLIWLVFRLFTSLWATLISAIRPLTALEKAIPLWPPASNLGSWLERALVQPWLRWDAEWYVKIVTSGYSASDGTAQFHPLFAWLAIPLARLGIDPLLSLLLVSSVAGLIMLYMFEKLANLDLDGKTARIATLLLISFPIAFILFAPYTESLFLLCAVRSLYCVRTGKAVQAGVLGALAALTRQQGIFLVFPLAWELWENSGRDLRQFMKTIQNWASVIGPVVGLAAWLVYRAVSLNDFNINSGSLTSLVYAGLISPSANKVVPVYQFTWPWQTLWLSLSHLKTLDVDFLIDGILGLLFIFMMGFSWPHMRNSYRIYSLVIVLAGFSYYTGPTHPLMGLPRHLYLAFPVFIGLAQSLSKSKRWLISLVAGISGNLFLVAGYILGGWVP